MNLAHGVPEREDEPEFLLCWKQQNCGSCLKRSRCSWCPFTQSCVFNKYGIQPLAPAYDENICPHWAERWEIRTHPLGCQVSTITSLTSLVSVASTLAVLLIIVLLVVGVRRCRKARWKGAASRKIRSWHVSWTPTWSWSSRNKATSSTADAEPLLDA
ncbi:hypothetical protein VTK73DRAFT_6632 [Phialemonium thermophilum]|uniref:PSI domain-containing protein n=1 Tax=Phialemonium thermophilum TaxID=223376 RepID=A0ABR3XV95_9PEZI